MEILVSIVSSSDFALSPTWDNILECLKNKTEINITSDTLRSNIGNEFLEAIQIKWILGECDKRRYGGYCTALKSVEKGTDKEFFKAVSKWKFDTTKGKILEAKKRRLMEILVSIVSSSDFALSPTYRSISNYLENKMEIYISHKTLRANIDNEFLEAIQIKWISGECKEEYKKYCDILDNVQKSTDEKFLKAVSEKKFNKVKGKVLEAKKQRVKGIILSRAKDILENDKLVTISSLSKATELGRRAIKTYIQDIDEILSSFNVLYNRQTPDQEIVSKIGIRVKDRDKEFHDLFGERLEQLWVFRELVGLMKVDSSFRQDSTILSFTHETLIEKLNNIVGLEDNVKHLFLDSFLDKSSNVSIDSPTVILPSVFPWLGKEASAVVLYNLSKSIKPDTQVVITFPISNYLNLEAESEINQLGFKIGKAAQLILTPSNNIKDASIREKMTERTNIVFLERTDNTTAKVDSVDLFIRPEIKEGSSNKSAKFSPRTYDPEDLSKAKVTLVKYKPEQYDFNAELHSDTPKITNIEYDEDAFIVEFENDKIAGFNMDNKPNIVEIEGNGVSNADVGMVHRMVRCENLDDNYFATPDLIQKYKHFVNKFGKKKHHINKTKIRH